LATRRRGCGFADRPLCALAEAFDRSPCLIAFDGFLRRRQARHLLAVSRDDDLLTTLNQIEELTELILGLRGPDLAPCSYSGIQLSLQ
jgi:hypothetical protein